MKVTEKSLKNSSAGGAMVGKRKGQTVIHEDGSMGGYLSGKLHSEGGIKATVKGSGQPLEMQGGEVVITAPAVASTDKYEFEGQQLTPRQILSKINVDGGGVAFAEDGLEIPKSIKLSGKSYNYGGKLTADKDIVATCGCKHSMEPGGVVEYDELRRRVIAPADYTINISEAKAKLDELKSKIDEELILNKKKKTGTIYGVRDESFMLSRVFWKNQNNADWINHQNNADIAALIKSPAKSDKYDQSSYETYGVKRRCSYREVYKKVTPENYYIATKAKFKDIPVYGEEKKSYWEELKQKYSYHKSPKSNSQYVLTPNGVYRKSDHWGRVASCKWDIYDDEGRYVINDELELIGYCAWENFEPNNDSFGEEVICPDYWKLIVENIFIDLENYIVKLKHLRINPSLRKKWIRDIDALIQKFNDTISHYDVFVYSVKPELFELGGIAGNQKTNPMQDGGEIKKYDKPLKSIINSEEAYAILKNDEALKSCTWQEGACYPLALSLKNVFGGDLMIIEDSDAVAGHVILKTGENEYVDSRGVGSALSKIKFSREMGVKKPIIVEFDSEKISHLGHGSEETVKKMTELLRYSLGIPVTKVYTGEVNQEYLAQAIELANTKEFAFAFENMKKANPEEFIKFIADQALGRNDEGQTASEKPARESTEQTFGADLVNLSIQAYPDTRIRSKLSEGTLLSAREDGTSQAYKQYMKGGILKMVRGGYMQRPPMYIPAEVKAFMPEFQQKIVAQAGRDGEYEYGEVVERLKSIIEKIPKTYQTDGVAASEKIVYLHYFYGQSDWYIVEKDSEKEQLQAYGYVILNGDEKNAEWGYISIEDLKSTGKVELDFNFEPTTIGDLFPDNRKMVIDETSDAEFEKIDAQQTRQENEPEILNVNAKSKKPATIKQKVADAADLLKSMKTHGELRNWAINNGMDNRSAFPKFKEALIEIGLNYDQIKTGIVKQKDGEVSALINYETTLYVDAKASAGKYGITDKNGNVLWYGRFFEDDDAGEQSRAELAAAKKAVWLASKIKEAIGEQAIGLTLYVDAQWLTYQNHSGQKGYALTNLARKYNISLSVEWIAGKDNPADKWTVASGYKKWSENDLKSLADMVNDENDVDQFPKTAHVDETETEEQIPVNNETSTDFRYGKDYNVPEDYSSKLLSILKEDGFEIIPRTGRLVVLKKEGHRLFINDNGGEFNVEDMDNIKTLGFVAYDNSTGLVHPESIAFNIKAIFDKAFYTPKTGESQTQSPAKEFAMPVVTNKKQQADLNSRIKNLIDEKGDNRAKYSPEDIALLKLYEGAGGLAKQGATGKDLFWQFFTPVDVCAKMWGLAVKYGFKFPGSSILEPAYGSCRLLQFIPKDAKVYVRGYEIEKTAYTIGKVLFPSYDMRHESFETMFFTGKRHIGLAGVDVFYDLVIGNPPYYDYVSNYAKLGEKEATGASTFEMYFIMRGVDVLKKGGLLIYIIPSSFMSNDNKYNSFKEALAKKCDLLDAYRLPSGVFPNTEVTTDLIVLRKK